jgi:ech hydrogenase subunit A
MIALVTFPLVVAILLYFQKKDRAYAITIRIGAAIVIALTLVVFIQNYSSIYTANLHEIIWLKIVKLIVEVGLSSYIIYLGIRSRWYLLSCFSGVQLVLTLWFEFAYAEKVASSTTIYMDKLSLLMLAIVGIIGSLIAIYAVGYMVDYHHHHPEVKDRRGMFFSVIFLFMSAMFGLVMFNDLSWLLFCWEITSFCSYLMIGYTKTEEATHNALLALVINVGGGLLFTIAIVILGVVFHLADIQGLLNLDYQSYMVMLPVFLLVVAGMTKSAQMPFSKWLLGAMVAPTPTSALLHSSTMVKAGVYLIIRLAPMLGDNLAGELTVLVGGVTFLAAATLAITQRDAKRVLAYSTISNLGLIVACAGIGTAESLWAALMLIVFHAIAKSLLFLSVGSTEHQLGSRDIEAMDGLYKISTPLTFCLVIGIAGMFIAPFGMLISKWAAMKAFVDSHNIIIVMIVAFGSTLTLFFWTKWLGKLLANAHHTHYENYKMHGDEKFTLYSLAFMVIVVCLLHPLVSKYLAIPYIDSNLHIEFVSPINPMDSTIIIFMLCLLFILPVVLIPLYQNSKIKPSSIYMAGENTGDNETFHASMGEQKQVDLKNWYLTDFFHTEKCRRYSLMICTAILLIGLCAIIGGLFS